ncbi:alkaline phosphatase [Bacteroidota bacterium]
MKLKSISIVIFFVISLAYVHGINIDDASHTNKAKNIILIIGDGMGLTHLYAAYTVNKGNLNITKFPVIGIQNTFSIDNYITDSGASGTAIATGKKTRNGMIGMGPDSTKLKSILEIAEENNLSTGLVVTSKITHATPATFIAHNIDRDNYEELAMDFLKTDIDVFIGGGREDFDQRRDKLNLIDSLKNKGYTVLYDIEKIKNCQSQKLAGFTSDSHNPKISEGRKNVLSISTQTAINILSQNENGFFLMVEGSQIDWGGHDNDIEYVTNEVLDLDKAIGVALDFAIKNGETIVIVTSDHETGGLGIIDGDIKKGELDTDFASEDHTGVWVPVYAYGPGATLFQGFYDNTDIFYKMLKVYGF